MLQENESRVLREISNLIIVLSTLQQFENEISGSFYGCKLWLDEDVLSFPGKGKTEYEGLLTHLKDFAVL